MPNPGYSDETLQAAIDLVQLHGSIRKAALMEGIPRQTMQDRIRCGAERLAA